jgi:hypothetical protein
MDDALRGQAEAFQRCIEERDAGLAATVLDPGYALVLVHPEPVTVPRERWLAVLPEYVVHDYAVREQIADVAGDLAVILQRVEMRATVLGVDRSGTFVISDTWRRGPDWWRVWRRHSTPLAALAMPGG